MIKNFDLSYIIDDDFRQEVQDFFAFATGFGVVFIDHEGHHIGAGSNFSNFCKCMNDSTESAKHCTKSNQKAIQIGLTSKYPCIYLCHAELINIEIPLIYDDCCVGAITAGQVLCEDPQSYPKDEASDFATWDNGTELSEYYKEIKVLSRKQIDATTAALTNISNYILQKVAYGQIQKDLSANREKLLLYEKQQIEMKHQLKLAQLDALQKQVTPHFIFNVINSVSRLISLSDYDTAKQMLDAFAEMMRYSLSNVTSTVSLHQELNYIENFLTIQKIRFGELIHFKINCDSALYKLRIPFFSLQPLIENSVKHGILNRTMPGSIEMSCTFEREDCHIHIVDNGEGIEGIQLEFIRENYLTSQRKNGHSKHIGLYNCYNRMKMLFGEDIHFQINSVLGKGTNIHIKIVDAASKIIY